MSCVEILKHLEENINVLQKMEYLLKWGGELSYQELMMDIGIDAFRGYEYFLTCCLRQMIRQSSEQKIDCFCNGFAEKLKQTGQAKPFIGLCKL